MKLRYFFINEELSSEQKKKVEKIKGSAISLAKEIVKYIEKKEYNENIVNNLTKKTNSILKGLSYSEIEIFHTTFNTAMKERVSSGLVKKVQSEILKVKETTQPTQAQAQPTQAQPTQAQAQLTQAQAQPTQAQAQPTQAQPTQAQAQPTQAQAQPTQAQAQPTQAQAQLTQAQPTQVIIGNKDKTLKNITSNETEIFSKELDEPSESEFIDNISNYNGTDLRTSNNYKIPDFLNKNNKFPKKYLNLIERMANAKMYSSTEPPISTFISKGGAGKINAQAGEILTMAFSTMSDDEVKTFSDSLFEHIKSENKNEKLIITKDWVKAALDNRKAIHNILKSQYKDIKIPDDIENSSWDTKDDVEALGLDNYSENKGFSTDIYLKVKSNDGYYLEEISLKKDTKVNFLNSGAGIFNEWDENLKDNINPIKYRENQKNKLISNIEKIKKDIDTVMNEDNDISKELKNIIPYGLTDIKANSRTDRKILKQVLEIMSKYNDSIKKDYDDLISDERKFKNEALNEIIKNSKMKEGMLKEISREFPLKAVSEGEEKMAIGDLALNKDVMEKIFNTSNWDDIKEKLVAVGGDKPYIAYKVDALEKEIPIAEISIREDGVGYGGQFKFEMKLDSRFAKVLKKANEDLYKIVENFFYNITNRKINLLIEKYINI